LDFCAQYPLDALLRRDGLDARVAFYVAGKCCDWIGVLNTMTHWVACAVYGATRKLHVQRLWTW
jgi:hypothetical protein